MSGETCHPCVFASLLSSEPVRCVRHANSPAKLRAAAMAAHADPTQSTMMDTISAAPSAEIQWLVSGRVKIKLKANGNTDLNAVYDAGPLPDALRLLDDDDEPIEPPKKSRSYLMYALASSDYRVNFILVSQIRVMLLNISTNIH